MASRGMAAVPKCPACKQTAIYLLYARDFGAKSLRYYRCRAHVWGVHKNDPRVIRHITTLPKKPDALPVE